MDKEGTVVLKNYRRRYLLPRITNLVRVDELAFMHGCPIYYLSKPSFFMFYTYPSYEAEQNDFISQNLERKCIAFLWATRLQLRLGVNRFPQVLGQSDQFLFLQAATDELDTDMSTVVDFWVV